MWLYYKKIFGVVWKDFKTATGEQMIGAFLAVAIFFFQIYLGVVHRADVRASSWAIAWPYLLLLTALFFWHLVRAPWKLDVERANTIAASQTQLIALTDKPDLRNEALKLSKEIMDFAYERSQNAPALTASRFVGYEDTANWLQEMDKFSREQQTLKNYEKDTLGMYDYRFKRRVAAILSAFKEKGLSDEWLDGWVDDMARWLVPYSDRAKDIGTILGQLADRDSL